MAKGTQYTILTTSVMFSRRLRSMPVRSSVRAAPETAGGVRMVLWDRFETVGRFVDDVEGEGTFGVFDVACLVW